MHFYIINCLTLHCWCDKQKSHLPIQSTVIFTSSLSVILVSWFSSGRNTWHILNFIFLLFNSITSALTAYYVGVFKPTVHDHSNSSDWNTKFSNMFIAPRKYDLKKDKLELEYLNWNLMTKRDLGFDLEDICRKLEIIPGFHFYITEINSKYQSSFLFSLKVELM